MRVICISNEYHGFIYSQLSVGDTYTVVEETECLCGCGTKGYILQEVDTDTYMFVSECFAPISDIENLQLSEEDVEKIRERQTQPIIHENTN